MAHQGKVGVMSSVGPVLKLRERRDLFPHAYHREEVQLFRLEPWIHAYDSEPGWEIDIDPPYQRQHVWSITQRRAYMEYILRGGEVSRRILFASRPRTNHEDQRWRLLDGKQRLSAAIDFMNDRFSVFEEEVEGGFKASQIVDLRRQRYTLEIQVVEVETMADEIALYLAINSGGTPHSDEELERVRAMIQQQLPEGERK